MTDPNSYTYSAPDGDLTVTRHGTDNAVVFEITGEPDVPQVTIPIADLPGLHAGVFETAGEQTPILLDRPDPQYLDRANTAFGLLHAEDGKVVLETCCGNCSRASTWRVTPDVARATAAVLAAMGAA